MEPEHIATPEPTVEDVMARFGEVYGAETLPFNGVELAAHLAALTVNDEEEQTSRVPSAGASANTTQQQRVAPTTVHEDSFSPLARFVESATKQHRPTIESATAANPFQQPVDSSYLSNTTATLGVTNNCSSIAPASDESSLHEEPSPIKLHPEETSLSAFTVMAGDLSTEAEDEMLPSCRPRPHSCFNLGNATVTAAPSTTEEARYAAFAGGYDENPTFHTHVGSSIDPSFPRRQPLSSSASPFGMQQPQQSFPHQPHSPFAPPEMNSISGCSSRGMPSPIAATNATFGRPFSAMPTPPETHSFESSPLRIGDGPSFTQQQRVVVGSPNHVNNTNIARPQFFTPQQSVRVGNAAFESNLRRMQPIGGGKRVPLTAHTTPEPRFAASTPPPTGHGVGRTPSPPAINAFGSPVAATHAMTPAAQVVPPRPRGVKHHATDRLQTPRADLPRQKLLFDTPPKGMTPTSTDEHILPLDDVVEAQEEDCEAHNRHDEGDVSNATPYSNSFLAAARHAIIHATTADVATKGSSGVSLSDQAFPTLPNDHHVAADTEGSHGSPTPIACATPDNHATSLSRSPTSIATPTNNNQQDTSPLNASNVSFPSNSGASPDAYVLVEFKRDRYLSFKWHAQDDQPNDGPMRLPKQDDFVVVSFGSAGSCNTSNNTSANCSQVGSPTSPAIDAGVVVDVIPADPARPHFVPQSMPHPVGHVLRIATDADCEVIDDVLPAAEEHAIQEAHELIHFLHLPFQVVDVEMRFDLQTIRVFYSLRVDRSSSFHPNIGRFEAELSHRLRAKVVLETVKHNQ